ncbi:MAG: adenosylcobinamide-GDP ribazoletransferase [Pikeienuella sp.]
MGLRRELTLYLSAQQFLTRLPAPGRIGHEEDRLARASRYFSLVGLVVGGVGALVWLAATGLPPQAAALLALGAMAFVTGGLHEDGLADCCDGLGGGRTRERALEIMRDSRIGAHGALGLLFSVGLRAAALAALAPAAGATALIVAAMAGRAGIALVLAAGTYARAEGAAMTAMGARWPEAALAAGFAFIAGACAGWAGLLAVFVALALARLWLCWLKRRLGGYTGDGLGAAEQIGEIAALLILAGAAS